MNNVNKIYLIYYTFSNIKICAKFYYFKFPCKKKVFKFLGKSLDSKLNWEKTHHKTESE